MDENKLKKLKDIKYEIRRACSNCAHGRFQPNQIWGVCNNHTYEHLKHTESKRQLSIHQSGYCRQHDYISGFNVGKFEEFLEP